MSKRAEQATKEIYKDGIELFGRRDRNGNLIIHPETMVGILRNACQIGYEQAEKDTIERAIIWLKENWREYVWTTDNGIPHFGHWENDFRKAMEEE